jgi:DNA-binding ferritin-like protein (Dps family)
MSNIIKKIIGDKKEWRQMEARAKALPEEYEFVYHKIQNYMWNYAAGHSAGMDMIPIFKDLLGLFEEGAANGKHVLEITGEDVAAFCDELLRSASTYTENWREALNRDILKELRKKKDSK